MTEMPEIARVKGTDAIRSVAVLAHEIWNTHYVPIIGQAQVDYMLRKYQSPAAITRQIAEGYAYYLVVSQRDTVGYFALVHGPSGASTQLSKLYVREDQRGHGVGRAIMAFVEARAIEMGSRELWLTVNRHNAGSIAFYRRMKFTTSESFVQAIGGGFVMDDFKMVKPLAQPSSDLLRK
jgi:GNAT superfamily N-acetyltransferase